MNNIMMSLKRFFRNKNTVTIIGVVLGLGILYFTYSSQINNAVKPVSVPVAKVTIQPRTEITADMVTTIEVPAISVSENVVRYANQVIGKSSNVNSVIPAGSMFFTDTVIASESLPDAVFVEVKDGEKPYNFPVDINSTYGNSIMPGNIIDIYMKAENDNGEIMVGKLVSNVKVLAVIDNTGRDVFENTENQRTPATIIFGVPEDIHLLLRKASFMGNEYSVELFPVPRGGTNIDVNTATYVSSSDLRSFIEAKTKDVKEDALPENTPNTTPSVTDSTTNNENTTTEDTTGGTNE